MIIILSFHHGFSSKDTIRIWWCIAQVSVYRGDMLSRRKWFIILCHWFDQQQTWVIRLIQQQTGWTIWNYHQAEHLLATGRPIMNRTAWLAEYCLWLRACTVNLRSLGVANFFMTWPQRHQMAVSKRAPPKSTAVGGPEEQLVIYCWKTVDLSKRNDSTHKKSDSSDTSKKHGSFTSKNGWLPKPPIDSPRKVEHSHLTQRINAQKSQLAVPKWGQEGKQKRCEKGGGQLGTSLGASRDLRSFSRI